MISIITYNKNIKHEIEPDIKCKENLEKNPSPRWDLNPQPSVI